MFKNILIFLLLATLSGMAYGQKLSFGLRSGVNYSNQTWHYHQFMEPTVGLLGEESRYRTKYATGFKLGVFADIGITRFFSVMPGLLYNVKGMRYNLLYYNPDQPPHFFKERNKVSLNYLSFDVPLKFKINTAHWVPYILAGVRVDRLLGYKQSIDKKYFEFLGPGFEGYKEIYTDLNKINIGLLTAIGVERKLSPGMNVFLEVEYNVNRTSDKPWITINNSLFALNGGIRWMKN